MYGSATFSLLLSGRNAEPLHASVTYIIGSNQVETLARCEIPVPGFPEPGEAVLHQSTPSISSRPVMDGNGASVMTEINNILVEALVASKHD